MNLKEDIRPISYIKTNAAEVLKLLSEREKEIGNSNMISQDELFYEIKKTYC